MAFPDRIERTVTLNRAPSEVWKALTTADGLSAWFGERATSICASVARPR